MIVTKIISKIREKGFGYLFKRFSEKLIHISTKYLFRRESDVFFIKELGQQPSETIGKNNSDSHIYVYNDPGQLDLATKTNMEQSRMLRTSEIEERLRNDEICFVVKNEANEVMHYSWVVFDRRYIRAVDQNIVLGDDEAFIYDAYTFKAFRGRSIYSTTLRRIENYLCERKFRRVYIDVLRENIPSIRGAEKAGFKAIKRFSLWTLFKAIKLRKVENLACRRISPSGARQLETANEPRSD